MTSIGDLANGLPKEEKEKHRITQEAERNVEKIRAANAMKIMEKRSQGEFATGRQTTAQNKEIAKFVEAGVDPAGTIERLQMSIAKQGPRRPKMLKTRQPQRKAESGPAVMAQVPMMISQIKPEDNDAHPYLKEPKEEVMEERKPIGFEIPSANLPEPLVRETKTPPAEVLRSSPSSRPPIFLRRPLVFPSYAQKKIKFMERSHETKPLPVTESESQTPIGQRHVSVHDHTYCKPHRPMCPDRVFQRETGEDIKQEPMEHLERSLSPVDFPTLSPSKVYLGAEEPMKDLDDDKYKFNRVEVKFCEKFTAKQLQPFGRRPPGTEDDLLTPGLSLVMLPQLEPDLYSHKVREEEKALRREKAMRKKLLSAEKNRQKKSLARNLKFNGKRMTEYMDTEEFQQTQKPESEMSPFEKIMLQHDALAKIPAYSERLSVANPGLWRNLKLLKRERVITSQSQQFKPVLPVRNYGKKIESKPAKICGPVVVDLDSENGEKTANGRIDRENTMKLLDVSFKGTTAKVPRLISCHLCEDVMRLCMRRSKYRGELREYPAYRCLRKGCQTFRSIKNFIEGTPVKVSQPRNSFWKSPVQPESVEPKLEMDDEDELIEWSAFPEEHSPSSNLSSTPSIDSEDVDEFENVEEEDYELYDYGEEEEDIQSQSSVASEPKQESVEFEEPWAQGIKEEPSDDFFDTVPRSEQKPEFLLNC